MGRSLILRWLRAYPDGRIAARSLILRILRVSPVFSAICAASLNLNSCERCIDYTGALTCPGSRQKAKGSPKRSLFRLLLCYTSSGEIVGHGAAAKCGSWAGNQRFCAAYPIGAGNGSESFDSSSSSQAPISSRMIFL